MTETSDTAIGHVPLGGAYPEPPDRATPADAQRPDTVRAAPDSSAAELADQVATLRQQIGGPVSVAGTVEQTTELEPARRYHDDEPHLSVTVKLSDYDTGDRPSGVEIEVHASGGKGTSAAVVAAQAYQEVSNLLTEEEPAAGSGDSAHG